MWWQKYWFHWLAGRLHKAGNKLTLSSEGIIVGIICQDAMCILPTGRLEAVPAVGLPCPPVPPCLCVAAASDWLPLPCPQRDCPGSIDIQGTCLVCGGRDLRIHPGRCPAGCVPKGGSENQGPDPVDGDPERRSPPIAVLCPLCRDTGLCPRCWPAIASIGSSDKLTLHERRMIRALTR